MKKIAFLIIIFITTFITAQEANQNQSDFDFGNGVSLSFEDGDYNFNINGFIKPTYVYNEMTSIVDGGTINEINRQFKSKNSRIHAMTLYRTPSCLAFYNFRLSTLSNVIKNCHPSKFSY